MDKINNRERQMGSGSASFISSQALGRRISHYASHASNVSMLEGALTDLSVSKYQLADLLQVRPRSNLYGFFGGPRRPSNLLLVRLLRLYHLQAAGLHVFEMKSVNWSSGVIEYRDGKMGQLAADVLAPTQNMAGTWGLPRIPAPSASPYGHRPGPPASRNTDYPEGHSGPVY